MKKNFRFGFSYIELVFAMAIVVILMAISAPFITKKTHSEAGSSYGEYQCWTAYNQTNGRWELYERSRYNTNEFDFPNGKKVETCKFMKPTGSDEYEVTLVSGGGGGSMAEFQKDVLVGCSSCSPVKVTNIGSLFSAWTVSNNTYTSGSTTYYIRSHQAALDVTPGVGGESGKVITFKTFIKSFDEDNEIKINICNTDYTRDNITGVYQNRGENNKFCVGKGGEGATYSSDAAKHSMGISKQDFYKLLRVYDDKMAVGGDPNKYFGTGDGILNTDPSSEDMTTLTSNGLTRTSSVTDFISRLNSLSNKVTPGTNTGSLGDYTHFITNTNIYNEYCKRGNCIVPGGDFGITPEDSYIKVGEEKCEKQGDGIYCFGTKYASQSEGKYNNIVAEKGNSVVGITRISDNSPYIAGCSSCIWDNNQTNSIVDGFGSSIKEVYSPLSKDFGAGGGGGGYTFYANTDFNCGTYAIKGTGASAIVIYKDSSTYNTLTDINLKNKITCGGLTNHFNGKDIILKRTNGGMGSGGAIIIKW